MGRVLRSRPGPSSPAPFVRHRNSESRTGAGGVGCRVDALEPRTLLAFAPVGEPFLVWAGGILPRRPQVAVAADDRGDFVAVWSQPDASGDADIHAQRYNA